MKTMTLKTEGEDIKISAYSNNFAEFTAGESKVYAFKFNCLESRERMMLQIKHANLSHGEM